MKILLLGGTGAIGTSLASELANADNEIYITSRNHHDAAGRIHFFCGDAHDETFLFSVLQQRYDAIVDFMMYTTDELHAKIEKLLLATEQYVFLSSSRVYSYSEVPLREDSKRLLDFCKDENYLSTDEYALTKAREEDVLFESKFTNWTIVRPYITYNTERLQLGVFEKEQWLYRALQGRAIVFQRAIGEHITTLTSGDDVARVIGKLLGKREALGKTFHIASHQKLKWNDVMDIYLDVLKKNGIQPKVYYVDDPYTLCKVMMNSWQIKYDRLCDRSFDNSNLVNAVGNIEYVETNNGLRTCMENFLNKSREWRKISWELEGYMDRLTGDKTPLSEIDTRKGKIKYIMWRYLPLSMCTVLFRIM